MKFPDDYIEAVGIEPFHVEEAGVIWNADCRDILPKLPKVDLLLTDPPYPTYLTKEYKYDENILQILSPVKIQPQIIFWTPGASFPLTYDACHVWDKRVGTPTQFELIYMRGIKNGHRIYRYYMINSSVAASFTHDYYSGHSSQKPIKLIKKLLIDNSLENNIILDPFLGSGTTAVAAKELGRKFIGIEISREYCEIARKRLRQQVLNFNP